MSGQEDLLERIRLVSSTASGGFLIGISVFALAGWLMSRELFTTLMPGGATMKANTALCFCLSGISILMTRRGSYGRTLGRLTAAFLMIVMVVALLSLFEYGSHRNLGIDELLVRDTQSLSLHQPPGRMSEATAWSFLCLAGSLLILERTVLSSVLAVTGIFLALISLVGFLYKTSALYAVRPFSSVSLPTAAGFFVFGLGVLILQRRQGLLPILISGYAGSAMIRQLMIGALLLPPSLGSLCLVGQRLGWFPPEFTLGVMTALLMVSCSVLLWWTSHAGYETDRLRRQAEVDLGVERDKLGQSNAYLEQYSYAAAHDLQEPLRMITIYSQLLAKNLVGTASPDLLGYLRVLQSSAERMSELVNALFEHSRLRSELDETASMVDLQEVVSVVLAAYQQQIASRQAEVEVHALPVIRGHRSQFVQLFENLLGNALKFQRSGVPPKVDLTARRESGHWLFAISDNGVGFSMNYAEQIFGMFKRLHGREVAGTGVGLALCKRIVDNHKGRIWAESTPGAGSSFYLSLPIDAKDGQDG